MGCAKGTKGREEEAAKYFLRWQILGSLSYPQTSSGKTETEGFFVLPNSHSEYARPSIQARQPTYPSAILKIAPTRSLENPCVHLSHHLPPFSS